MSKTQVKVEKSAETETHTIKVVCNSAEQAELLAKQSADTLAEAVNLIRRINRCIADGKSKDFLSKHVAASSKSASQTKTGFRVAYALDKELATTEDKELRALHSGLEAIAGLLPSHERKLILSLSAKQTALMADIAAAKAVSASVTASMQAANA